MRNTLYVVASLAATVLCWGMYGPVLQLGQMGMSTMPGHAARLRPFVCVGFAYFLIGVIVPTLWLRFRGEKGDWTASGVVWSLAGGALGALGALGIVLAFTFGGQPVYVMPLVFGGAPVVNAFLTIYMAGRMKEIGPWFLAGLIMVLLGSVTVLIFSPHPAADTNEAELLLDRTWWDWASQLLAISLTIVSWGSYGPVLHRGQAAMHSSRMRPLICVGLAYFLIAVIVPYFFLGEFGENSRYVGSGAFFRGTIWALAAGTFGALGALGVILAFRSGGKPVFVMPLIFGGAPVVNTFFTMAKQERLVDINAFFLAGLILVIAGSAIVLVLAPRGEKGEPPKIEDPPPVAESPRAEPPPPPSPE